MQRKAGNKFRHRRKNSIEIDSRIQCEFDADAPPPVGVSSTQLNIDTVGSPSGSLQVHDVQSERIVREQWAATRIQTAFRGFLVLNFLIIFSLSQQSVMLYWLLDQVLAFSNGFIFRFLFLDVSMLQL